MASSLSGLSALGTGLGFIFSADCQEGYSWSMFAEACQPSGVCPNNKVWDGAACNVAGAPKVQPCPSGQFRSPSGECTTNFCPEGNEPAPGGGCQPSKCKPGQVQWSEGGVEKCGTMVEYNAYVAKVTGKTPSKTGGDYVKTTPPVIGQTAESSIPWGTVAVVGLVLAGGYMIYRKKHMAKNPYDYDYGY